MNLHGLLLERAASGRPLRVGLIGAGKFGAMFLAQVRRMPGVHLMGVANLSPERASESLRRVGYSAEQIAARTLDAAVQHDLAMENPTSNDKA